MSLLRAEALSRTFGGVHAVDDVSFVVERGERCAIIGPNGAGKTTLFNLLSGELAPSSGQIFFEGEAVTRLAPAARARRGMGRTFQRNNLFAGLSVFQNVSLAVQQRLGLAGSLFRPAAREADMRAETARVLDTLGLAARASEVAGSLSYGEQRQLEMALALAIQPRLLLLDEPTAGMSPAETQAMTHLIADLPRDMTVLIIEHDMDVIFHLADHLIVLHQGQLIADGPPSLVRADPRVQEVYLGVGEEMDF